MEQQTKDEKIRDMLNKQSLIIGLAPISKQHLDMVEKNMIKRGALSEDDPREERRQRTIKSVIKNWANKNLKISN